MVYERFMKIKNVCCSDSIQDTGSELILRYVSFLKFYEVKFETSFCSLNIHRECF